MKLRMKARTKWTTGNRVAKKICYRIRVTLDSIEIPELIKRLEKLK